MDLWFNLLELISPSKMPVSELQEWPGSDRLNRAYI